MGLGLGKIEEGVNEGGKNKKELEEGKGMDWTNLVEREGREKGMVKERME